MSHIEEGILHAYLDGECSEPQRGEIEQHLEACVECRERLESAQKQTRRASDLLGQLEPGPVRQPSWEEIEARAAARGRSSKRRPRRPRRPWLVPSLAWAASIAVAFGAGYFTNAVWKAPRSAELNVAVRQAEAPAADAGRLAPENATAALRQRVADDRDATAPSEARLFETEEARPVAKALPASSAEKAPDAGRREGHLAGAGAPGEADRADREGEDVAAQERLAASAEDAPAGVAADRVEPQTPKESEQAARKLANEAANRADLPAEAVEGEVAEEETQFRDARARREAERLSVPAVGALTETKVEAGATAQRGLAAGDRPDLRAAGRFFQVEPEEAAAWIGAELRTLPELTLERVEVGPGSAVVGGLVGLPAIQLVYEDAAGLEVTLIQQLADEAELSADEREPALIVEPSGVKAYRWLDGRGYRLILAAVLSSDSLRALADRVR